MGFRAFFLSLFITFIAMAFYAHAQSSPPSPTSQELYHSARVAFGPLGEARSSLDWIAQRKKPDMAAHLIAAMRFSSVPRGEVNDALHSITGEKDINTWFDWMLWLGEHERKPPHESFLAFKSVVFYTIDKNFKRFFTPDTKFSIRPEEIVWGGVRVDGIPALDNPKHISIAQAEKDYILPDDEVFGVEINGDARAYPIRIMGWHEMFNDVVGGVPVSLAYCTLCDSGILFEGNYKGREKFGVKEPFTFGSSGFLYHSNKLMYDRQTDSLWNQYTGQPVSGKLLGSGIELDIRPVVITSWEKWKKEHPDTKVLSVKTGFNRNYGAGVVYKDYFASERLMFPALADKTKGLREKQYIYAMRLKSGNKAWPLTAFKGGRVLNDAIGTQNIVLMGDAKTRTVRAYERKGHQFDATLKTKDGIQWTRSEDVLISTKGERLERLSGHLSYWFAWSGYLGDDAELFVE